MASIKTFEAMLEKGPDNALLRYSLGNAYATDSRPDEAIAHLVKALEFDDQYSAAWKLLGRCYFDTDNFEKSVQTYQQGIVVAEANCDKQAAKEMTVFLKRARKNVPG